MTTPCKGVTRCQLKRLPVQVALYFCYLGLRWHHPIGFVGPKVASQHLQHNGDNRERVATEAWTAVAGYGVQLCRPLWIFRLLAIVSAIMQKGRVR